jgi:hypothetical protein
MEGYPKKMDGLFHGTYFFQLDELAVFAMFGNLFFCALVILPFFFGDSMDSLQTSLPIRRG